MRTRSIGPFAFLLATAALAASEADAQRGAGRDFRFTPPAATLTLHGGLAMPRANSELFRFTTDELTIAHADFTAASIGVDLALVLGDRTDLVLGFMRDESSNRSEFRDWVDNNGLPIEQTTRFLRQPLTATIRYNFSPRGRTIGSYAWVPTRIVPFVGGGVGVMQYEFEQVGDFIDMGTLDVFFDRYTETGWSTVVQGSAGATFNLNPYLQLIGEVRYLQARGDRSGPGDDFQGFGRLDLSGTTTTFGIALRF